MRIRSRLLAIIASAALLTASNAAAQNGRGDWDGDGFADFVSAAVNQTANTTIFTIRTSFNSGIGQYQFNAAADALVTGKFYPDKRTFPGIVKADKPSGSLRWTFKNPAGQEVSLLFGLPGDLIPNQGDLDCDGRTDLITTRPGPAGRFAGFRLWYVALSSGGFTQEQVFGLATDAIGVADMNGDGCDELIALRPSTFTWFSKGLFQDDSQIQSAQWGLPGDIPLLPHDVSNDGLADYLVVRPGSRSQTAHVLYNNLGFSDIVSLGAVSTVPTIGKFFGSNTLGWVDRVGNIGTVRTPFGTFQGFPFISTNQYIIRPDGTVVAPNDTGRIGGAALPPPSAPPVSNPTKYSACDKNLNPNDGRSANITYNPENSRGQPKLILPSAYNSGVSSVDLFQGDKFIANCKRATPNEHGNRPRWYCQVSLGSTPKNVTFVIKKGGVEQCIFIPNPRNRYD